MSSSKRDAVQCAMLRLAILLVMCCVTQTSNSSEFTLLSNGNVIEGHVTHIGNSVIIDRGDGSELKLSSRQVLHSASSLIELLHYRRHQHATPHLQGFHDDARWCYQHRLYDEMRQALDAADTLDPTHPESARLRRQLAAATATAGLNKDRHSTGNQPAAEVPAVAGRMVIQTETVKPSAVIADDVLDSELEKANLASHALFLFGSRIQPLLVNRCGNAGCHRSPADNGWQLTITGSATRPSSRVTKANLAATLPYISRSPDEESLLLRYAQLPHGGKTVAPLKRGDETPLAALREWLAGAFENENQHALNSFPESGAFGGLPTVSPSRFPPLAPFDSNPVKQASHADDEGLVTLDEASKRVFDPRRTPPGSPTPQRNRPTRLPTVVNPFDPDIFNRLYR